ncbi:MAG: GNAT family N-acetyltransferase, partial [Anaerolineales bacterium]
RLLSHALQYLNSEGAQSSFLEVRAGNIVAQEMYRKFGYKESGRRRHYYKDNDEDAILMHLDPLKVEHFMSAIGPSTLDKEEQNER